MTGNFVSLATADGARLVQVLDAAAAELDANGIAAEIVEYVFGKTDMGDWRRIIDEKMTPPRQLPKHDEASGFHRKARELDALRARIAAASKELRADGNGSAVDMCYSEVSDFAADEIDRLLLDTPTVEETK